ncbi:MAG: hypothetical protein HOF89_01545 [Candidatus Nitrosopelagicus sp.]|jgi:hypothetical protein|nr:hypothetical protein [Candidatus Nitrosopelagicus sp.]
MKIEGGLDFILSHFEEPLFPRTISTKKTENRQVWVNSRDEAIRYFGDSGFEDCRVSAFSQNDIELVRPNFIFIDLDDHSALEGTLYNITTRLHVHPTILNTGVGLAILLPIKMGSWINVSQYDKHGEELSKLFLQYTGRELSSWYSDTANHSTLRSCMIRIPSSINTKNGKYVTVNGLWNGVRADVHSLKFKKFVKKLSEDELRLQQKRGTFVGNTVVYIEKLLTRKIFDGRKRVCNLILIPYMINIKQLSIKETVEIIYKYFQGYIEKKSITCESKRVLKKGILPYGQIKMKATDPQLYNLVMNTM